MNHMAICWIRMLFRKHISLCVDVPYAYLRIMAAVICFNAQPMVQWLTVWVGGSNLVGNP